MTQDPRTDLKDRMRPLQPSATWLARQPGLAREAATHRPLASWPAQVARSGRWFLPLAAAVAALCWLLSTRTASAPPAPLLFADSGREVLAALVGGEVRP